jgi:hypothetical protein
MSDDLLTLLLPLTFILGVILHTAFAPSARKPTTRDILVHILFPSAAIFLIILSLRQATTETFTPIKNIWTTLYYGDHPPPHPPDPPFPWLALALTSLAVPLGIWKFPVFFKELLNDLLTPRPHIFTCPAATIAYQALTPDVNYAEVDVQLQQIFHNNPHADPHPLADALRIKIINFQPTKPLDQPKKPSGIYIGMEDDD